MHLGLHAKTKREIELLFLWDHIYTKLTLLFNELHATMTSLGLSSEVGGLWRVITGGVCTA